MNEFTSLTKREREALRLEAYLHQHEAVRTEKFQVQRASTALIAILFTGTILALGIIKPADKPLSETDSDAFALVVVGQFVIMSGYMLLQMWMVRMSAFIAGIEHKINLLVGDRAFDWELRWQEVSLKKQKWEGIFNLQFHALVAIIVGFEIRWISGKWNDVDTPFGATANEFLYTGLTLLAIVLIMSLAIPTWAKRDWIRADKERWADSSPYVHADMPVSSVSSQSVNDSENMQLLQLARRSIVIIFRWPGLNNPKE